MLVRHKSGAASRVVVGGRVYEPVGPALFDVPLDVARYLLRFPEWERAPEGAAVAEAKDAAEEAPAQQASGNRRRGGGRRRS